VLYSLTLTFHAEETVEGKDDDSNAKVTRRSFREGQILADGPRYPATHRERDRCVERYDKEEHQTHSAGVLGGVTLNHV
jgi:hypothetical protein